MGALLSIIGTIIAGLFGSTAGAAALQLMREQVQTWIESADFHALATEKVNARLRAAGVAYQFADILDADTIRAQVEGLAVHLVNVKLGTNLQGLSGASKDDILSDLSRVIAQKVNAECGSNIATLWPVQSFRSELATELDRQLLGADLAAGGLFPQDKLTKLKARWVQKMPGYDLAAVQAKNLPDAVTVKQARQRAYQKKYRRTHKYVAVPR